MQVETINVRESEKYFETGLIISEVSNQSEHCGSSNCH